MRRAQRPAAFSFDMPKLKDFYHDGFGWVCRHCEREIGTVKEDRPGLSRSFREGEAESREPRLANRALAKWADPARRFLTCPRCGITEDTEIH